MSAPATSELGLMPRFRAWRSRHARLELFLFFAAGFLWDVLMLGRIDSLRILLKQGVYLLVLTALLALEQRSELTGWTPPRAFAWAWRFREEGVHFLFGSLLSAYSLFYLKSASGLASAGFLLVLFGLLLANELPRFRRLGPLVRIALLSLCVTTYAAYLAPVLAGHRSNALFLGAVGLASLLLWLLYRAVRRWGGTFRAFSRVVLPGAISQLLLVLLYFAGAIPPVPLAVEYLGVYHDVERGPEGHYRLRHLRPFWEWWRHGEGHFLARPGDRIYCFVRVFAPARFEERMQLRFSRAVPGQGWSAEDVIPLPVVGVRQGGFEGYAFKERYIPGDWRVQVETEDGRELGEMNFTIVPDVGTDERIFGTDLG